MCSSSIGRQLLEQVHADAIVGGVAILGRLKVKRPGADFRRQIALDDFLDVLSNAQLIERLHVRRSVQEQNARNKLVGMLHLLNLISSARHCLAKPL